ncbi:FAD-binding oxidoreductase, partial [Nocardioides sp.]|uniref:NAD(P)/FAD-dependent oxidoreductase n=1 Tax=Nocardioides sp. TaxID=35761 RepID=UPI0027364B53
MRVRILGAGIIGLSCADELRRRGHDVMVVDPAPASGASWAAAGMLSPGGEAWHGEAELLRLGVESSALWPEYAGRLDVPLHIGGTLLAGCDAGDVQQLERQVDLLASHGVGAELLTGREARALEPTLGPRVGGGVHLREERSVDPRMVLAALRQRVREDVVVDGRSPSDPCDATVIATGAVLPEPFTHLVR